MPLRAIALRNLAPRRSGGKYLVINKLPLDVEKVEIH
jgi:hypothetical protein